MESLRSLTTDLSQSTLSSRRDSMCVSASGVEKRPSLAASCGGGVSTSTFELSHQLQLDRLSKQVRALQGQNSEVMTLVQEQVRRVADESTTHLKTSLEAEGNLQNKNLEAERQVRTKEITDVQAALQVARGRMSRLEGTTSVHSTRFKEMDSLADQMRDLRRQVETLQRTLESDRERHEGGKIETVLRDDFAISSSTVEVEVLKAVTSAKLGLESSIQSIRSEVREHSEQLQHLALDVESKSKEHTLKYKTGIESVEKTVTHEIEKARAVHDATFEVMRDDLRKLMKFREQELPTQMSEGFGNMRKTLVGELLVLIEAKQEESTSKLGAAFEDWSATLKDEIRQGESNRVAMMQKLRAEVQATIAEAASVRDDISTYTADLVLRQQELMHAIQTTFHEDAKVSERQDDKIVQVARHSDNGINAKHWAAAGSHELPYFLQDHATFDSSDMDLEELQNHVLATSGAMEMRLLESLSQLSRDAEATRSEAQEPSDASANLPANWKFDVYTEDSEKEHDTDCDVQPVSARDGPAHFDELRGLVDDIAARVGCKQNVQSDICKMFFQDGEDDSEELLQVGEGTEDTCCSVREQERGWTRTLSN